MKIATIGAPKNPLDRRVSPELWPLLSVGTELSGYPSRVPAFPFTAVEQAMQQLGHLDAALMAQADACDAVVIDSVGDYGLRPMRAALAIPSVGAGEAGMRAAGVRGRKFAIVSVWPISMNYIIEELLLSYGMQAQCTGILNVGEEGQLDRISGPDGYLAEVREGEGALLDKIIAAAHAAIAQGAEAVMFGCTCMSPIADRIQAACDFPVINPLAEGVKRAEQLVQRGERPVPRLREGKVELLSRMVGAVADETPEDCPVCVFDEA